jgi:hypothetical protein
MGYGQKYLDGAAGLVAGCPSSCFLKTGVVDAPTPEAFEKGL